jgi:hypothetical protein
MAAQAKVVRIKVYFQNPSSAWQLDSDAWIAVLHESGCGIQELSAVHQDGRVVY